MDTYSLFKQIQPFLFGGISGMFATTFIQPIDMVKVKIQIAGASGSSNPALIAKRIITEEGFLSLYTGLSAGLLRQATYTTARMGLFTSFSDLLRDKNGNLKFNDRAIAGLSAGALGAVVGTPCDLALIRMQSDSSLPAAQRRNYTGVANALVTIIRQEGVFGLWKGCSPTVARAMALNVGMLTTFDQAKDYLYFTYGKSVGTTLAASAAAGFFASSLSLPFDFVKTRVQKMTLNSKGVLPFSGSVDCAFKILRTEGPGVFYKGFWTYYVRIAPHAMITLLVADGLRAWAK